MSVCLVGVEITIGKIILSASEVPGVRKANLSPLTFSRKFNISHGCFRLSFSLYSVILKARSG